jgi:hypothetical protein
VFGQDIATDSDSKFGEHIRFGHLYWFLKWVLVKHLSKRIWDWVRLYAKTTSGHFQESEFIARNTVPIVENEISKLLGRM